MWKTVVVSAMWKTVVVSTVAVVVTGPSPVLAQGAGPFANPWANAEGIAVLTDAGIGALKAALKLTSAQEAHWPAIDAALRELLKATPGTHERIPRRPPSATNSRRTSAASRRSRWRQAARDLKKLADAADPLFQSLDDSQKQRLRSLVQMIGARHAAMMMMEQPAASVRACDDGKTLCGGARTTSPARRHPSPASPFSARPPGLPAPAARHKARPDPAYRSPPC